MARIREAGMTIVFVNTRAQAELMFQALWRLNEPTLPIALHHGSLEVEQRRRVEAAMADGKLRAVVATSSLDLGIDWGGLDQVIQVGAPKGVSRLLQRVGRANHRMDEASRAILVPANRFEVLECEAAMLGVAARELDGDPPRPGGLDVLAQHLLGLACAAPFRPDDVYAEVRRAAPYADLSRKDFDDVLGFVENGGYALTAYERWRKLFRDSEGRVHVRSERIARQHRMNIGTIVEAPLVKVRLVGKKRSARCSARWRSTSSTCCARATRSCSPAACCGSCGCTRPWWSAPRAAPASRWFRPMKAAACRSPQISPTACGAVAEPVELGAVPEDVQEWLRLQKARSRMPGRNDLLVETFPRGDRWYLVAYCFEGRNAHQTLGMLLTRRMERAGLCAARVRRHRLRARRLVGGAAARCGEAVRPGHAGRRSGTVAGGELDAAADLPQCRGDRGADRAASSGRGEDAQAGDGELRPDLRRAAPAPAGPHPAARDARRCRRRTDRSVAHRGHADAGEGPHRAHGAVARVAAGGAGAAGDRPRERADASRTRRDCWPRRRRSLPRRPARRTAPGEVDLSCECWASVTAQADLFRRRALPPDLPCPLAGECRPRTVTGIDMRSVSGEGDAAHTLTRYGLRVGPSREAGEVYGASTARSLLNIHFSTNDRGTIHLAGERLMLDPAAPCSGRRPACWSSPTCIWRKARSYARHGQLLPPWDTRATLDRLAAAAAPLAAASGCSPSATVSTTPMAPNRLPHGELARLQRDGRCASTYLGTGQPRSYPAARCRW